MLLRHSCRIWAVTWATLHWLNICFSLPFFLESIGGYEWNVCFDSFTWAFPLGDCMLCWTQWYSINNVYGSSPQNIVSIATISFFIFNIRIIFLTKQFLKKEYINITKTSQMIFTFKKMVSPQIKIKKRAHVYFFN